MPTLILVDTSLSMSRALGGGDESGRTLAVTAVQAFVGALKEVNRHEIVALAEFSHSSRLVVPWGRDWAGIEAAVPGLESGTKRVLDSALSWAGAEAARSFTPGSVLHLLLLSDGKGVGGDAAKTRLSALFPLPLPTRLHLVVLSPTAALSPATLADQTWLATTANADISEALEAEGSGLVLLDAATEAEVASAMETLVQSSFAPASASLSCGALSADVSIFPAPLRVAQDSDFTSALRRISRKLEILGFLKPSEWGSPPVVSRHLLLPTEKGGKEDKRANFCVLLHGSLKTEPLVAIVRVAPDWYGFIQTCDSKRSNLILYTLKPGPDSVPWLGRLDALELRPWTGVDGKTPFPSAARPPPSYALTPLTAWTERASLSSDLSKLTKYAKKLPDRKTQFYAELNRVVRHCLSLGFPEVLARLAAQLDEIKSTQGNPQLVAHIKHANACLRNPLKLKYEMPVPPLS